MRQYLNWKSYLVLAALVIVTASLFYTNQLARKLADEEKKKIELLVEGIKVSSLSSDPMTMSYTNMVTDQNKTIPMILTGEQDTILDYINMDTASIHSDANYLQKKLSQFKLQHKPIVSDFGFGKQYVYYGESYLLTQLRYFPYVQLAIIFLFLIVVLIAFSSAHRSIQNQVWVGLSKETAHQLGTPLSAIEGWLELLKDHEHNQEPVAEMQKDLDRLKLVAERFSKVGSAPQLEQENVLRRLENMVDYMQKRAPSKVIISLIAQDSEILVNISGPLFDWVIENLMRNALDAMEGKGTITVKVSNHPHMVLIDVQDTGKGIPRHMVKNVFNPGFTTKKRGWGLGLSLSKRIIETYHHGSLLVKQSEVGKGTTFRIILRR